MPSALLDPNDRKTDDAQERIVGDFLYKYFYSRVFDEVETVEDRSRQLAGIDVIADGMYIDNKAQSSPKYVNRPRGTYILELSFLDRHGKEMPGWFVNRNSMTTHYLFVWIGSALVDDENRIIPNGINKVEVMLVDKNQLLQTVGQFYTSWELRQIARYMRQAEMETRPSSLRGCHFSHSPRYREKPVSLVVRKEVLKTCATIHCYVTPKQIIHI